MKSNSFLFVFLLLIVLTSIISVNAVFTDNVIDYWNCDSGFTSVRGLTATTSGSVTNIATNGIKGGYCNFTGSSSLQYASGRWFSGNMNYTVNFFIKKIAGAGGLISMDVGNPRQQIYDDGGGNIATYVLSATNNTTPIQNSSVLATSSNTWTMVTISRNLTNYTIYFNGVIAKSSISGAYLEPTGYLLYFGRNDISYLQGSMDEISIFNRTLLPGEVDWLYVNRQITTYPFTSSINISWENNITTPLLSSTNYTFRINQYAPVGDYVKNSTFYLDNVLMNLTILSGTNFFEQYNFTYNLGRPKNNINFSAYSCNLANCYWTTFIPFNITEFVPNSVTFNSTTFETLNENFILNFSYDESLFTYSNSIFVYNGTTYPTTLYGNNIIISNATAPQLAGNKVFFYFNVSLTNSSGTFVYSSLVYNQSINRPTSLLSSTSCSAGYSPSLIFTSLYEENLTAINLTRADFIFRYGFSGNPNLYTINGTLSNINNFSICINNSQAYYFLGYGEVDYYAQGSTPRKYYIFQNTRITNQSIIIPLYNIESTIAQDFTITAQTSNLVPYNNNYIGLLRWYPSINSYNVVEIGKTDTNGQTVLNVKTETADYRLALYSSDGTLIKLINSLRFVCQVSPCTYTINVNPFNIDLTTFTGIQKSLTWDSTTKRFTFVWNDPTQTSQTINLTVVKLSGNSTRILCSNSYSGYTGVLICDVSAYSGFLYATATRTASPTMVLAELSSQITTTFVNSGGGTIGLLIGAILLILFALVGTIYPPLVVILGVLSLILLFLLGNITWVVFTAFGIIGGVVLHFLRRIS